MPWHTEESGSRCLYTYHPNTVCFSPHTTTYPLSEEVLTRPLSAAHTFSHTVALFLSLSLFIQFSVSPAPWLSEGIIHIYTYIKRKSVANWPFAAALVFVSTEKAVWLYLSHVCEVKYPSAIVRTRSLPACLNACILSMSIYYCRIR